MRKPDNYIKYYKIRSYYLDLYSKFNLNPKQFSLEHIVPQSLYKSDKLLKKDMHNIILFPNKLNVHRSNYKFISDFKVFSDSKILDSSGYTVNIKLVSNNDISIKTNSQKSFYPSRKYQGEIARATMYFLKVYPEYQKIIFENIINPYTILTWHYQNPVKNFEIEKNNFINNLQGNDNHYIIKSDNLVYDMETILNVDLKVFKNI